MFDQRTLSLSLRGTQDIVGKRPGGGCQERGGQSLWVFRLLNPAGSLWGPKGHLVVTCAIETHEFPLFKTVITGILGTSKFMAADET